MRARIRINIIRDHEYYQVYRLTDLNSTSEFYVVYNKMFDKDFLDVDMNHFTKPMNIIKLSNLINSNYRKL